LQDKSILVICPERQIYAELTPLVSQMLPLAEVVEVPSYPDRKTAGELLAKHQPWLCLVDVGKQRDQALATIAELSNLSRNLLVVALLPAKESDLILTCLRQGASEFLLRPLVAEQVQPVFERLTQVTTQQGSGRIVGVMPVKGACGASTIATSLAFQWKKFGAKRVLLADMDPSSGTLSFLLKLKSTYSFIDALSRAGTLDADLWKGIVSQSNGVDVLLSPENSNDQSGDLPDPTAVLRFCRQMYDNVTIDMGSAYGKWNMNLAAEADDLIIVTTNELPALRSAQRALAYLEAHNVPVEKTRLVINRYSADTGLTRSAIETALGQKIYQTVPSDYESVQRALVDGKQIAPASGFGRSLSALAEQLGEPYKRREEAGGKKVTASWTAKLSSFWTKKK
jgi:pilus assembly protein CpaE